MKNNPLALSEAAKVKQRQAILQALLEEVAFDGWTAATYDRAIRRCGLTSGNASLVFPRGIHDAVEFFGSVTDDVMLTRIKNEHGFAAFRTRDKIAFGVRARLEALTPYREAMRRLMFWYALPFHWPTGAKRLYQTVDLIWRAANDASTDFNFYTKRGLLAGVVKTTLLFWLDDETPGCQASWDFLDRRIAEVLQLGQTIGKFKKARGRNS